MTQPEPIHTDIGGAWAADGMVGNTALIAGVAAVSPTTWAG